MSSYRLTPDGQGIIRENGDIAEFGRFTVMAMRICNELNEGYRDEANFAWMGQVKSPVEIKSDELAALRARVADLEAAYRDGFVRGLGEYAWWKDGVQYVGTCGTTLEQAIERIEPERKPT